MRESETENGKRKSRKSDSEDKGLRREGSETELGIQNRPHAPSGAISRKYLAATNEGEVRISNGLRVQAIWTTPESDERLRRFNAGRDRVDA